MIKTLLNIGDDILSLFYPRLCIGCGERDPLRDEYFCLSCRMDVPFIKDRARVDAALVGKVSLPEKLNNVYALFYYTKTGVTQQLLRQLKYKRKPNVAVKLGCMLAEKYISEIDPAAVLVPVPIHPKRLHDRGYNQAERIAHGIQAITNQRIDTKVLKRVLHGSSQTEKSKEERQIILDQTFRLNEKQGVVTGQHYILIDDIMTTGSTLRACYDELMKTEPASISIATLGVTI